MTEGKKTKDVIEIVKLWIPSCNNKLMIGIITGARGEVEKMKLKGKSHTRNSSGLVSSSR